MSRKKCVRKVWKLMDPVQLAIQGAAITPCHLLDKLRMVELSAIESFRTGRATVSDWRSVADLLNVAETMARGGVGPEALESCEQVQAALEEAHDRYKATGRMGLTGPGIQAVRDLFEWHDLQRNSISRGEYERWIQKTANFIRSAHPSHKRVLTS